MSDAAGRIDVEGLTRELIDEILWRGPGIRPGSVAAALVAPLIRKPLRRFSEIAVGFDERVAANGFHGALDWLLSHFAARITVHGAENVPPSGPLLIASNHPGTCDAIAIAASAPRDDVRILAARIPFLDRLPATGENLLFTSPDREERRGAIWKAIQRLGAGGAVLMFPSGGLDPDPSCMPGAADDLDLWTPTVEVILRRVPATRLVPAVVSGVLLPRYVRHPLTRVRRKRRDRQRISEYLQVIRQMLVPGRLLVEPHITFGQPMTIDELNHAAPADGTTAPIAWHARRVLASHLDTIAGDGSHSTR